MLGAAQIGLERFFNAQNWMGREVDVHLEKVGEMRVNVMKTHCLKYKEQIKMS